MDEADFGVGGVTPAVHADISNIIRVKRGSGLIRSEIVSERTKRSETARVM